jgi:hypothetical protein
MGKRRDNPENPRNSSQRKKGGLMLDEIRPKRSEQKRETRELEWIKQHEYDDLSDHLNGLTDTQLTECIKKLKPLMKRPGRSVTQAGKKSYEHVSIPTTISVDAGVVHWMAKEILRTRKQAKS